MTGWIIYNGFWNSSPPPPVRSLAAAAEKKGVALVPVPNTALAASVGGGFPVIAPEALPPFALFWDKDTRLAFALEEAGVRLTDTARAVALCDDKAKTHFILARAGLPMPKTLVAPMTYTAFTEAGKTFLENAGRELGFPLVVKECFGSLGGQVSLARTPRELRGIAERMGAKPFLLQQWIPPGGKDKRLYLIGGKVAAAMIRENPSDFRANIGAGGRGTAYAPSAREISLARAAAGALGAEIAGVDLLDGESGPLLLEVNSSAQTAELSRCTGVDVDGEILRYIIEKEENSCGSTNT